MALRPPRWQWRDTGGLVKGGVREESLWLFHPQQSAAGRKPGKRAVLVARGRANGGLG